MDVANLTQSRHILITGSGGRLGKLLRAAHRRDGHGRGEVLFQSRQPGADVQWSQGDPTGVLPHCATLVALWGATSGDEATLEQNSALVDLIFEIARTCRARRVLHLSTAGVYGPGTALSEISPLHPVSAYGRAKCRMEARIKSYLPGATAQHVILRLANVVGADSLAPALRGTGVVRLDRFADGCGPHRSYIAASDVLRVFRKLSGLEAARCPPVLNVAAPKPVDMEALARAARKPVEWQAPPETAVQNVTLDATRLARLLAPDTLLSRPEALIRDWQELET